MYKIKIISYFIWRMAFFTSIGMVFFVFGVLVVQEFDLWLHFGFLFLFLIVLFAAFVSSIIGGIVGLILGIVSSYLPPMVIYNDKLYRLAMGVSAIISGVIISIVFWGKISKHLGPTDHLSIVESIVLSTVMAILLGFISQYLVSTYTFSYIFDMQEKRKNA